MKKKGDYKIGDAASTGQVIETILSQSSVAIVYTTVDNHLRWGYFAHKGAIPNWLLPTPVSFDSLMSKVKTVLPEQYRKEAYAELGKHLLPH